MGCGQWVWCGGSSGSNKQHSGKRWRRRAAAAARPHRNSRTVGRCRCSTITLLLGPSWVCVHGAGGRAGRGKVGKRGGVGGVG